MHEAPDTSLSDDLNHICESLRTDLETRNSARDQAISRSRELIRRCAECIRAIHRREWADVDERLRLVSAGASELNGVVAAYPDLRNSGYTQDALKEVVEAFLTHAIIRQLPWPTPADLGVQTAEYLNGMAEAATELRRFILDIMRREDRHSDEAERLLVAMDAIYDQLVTFDFPDALTNGLRRQTDVVRGVLERTRGDLTQSLRQQKLQNALARLETHLGADET